MEDKEKEEIISDSIYLDNIPGFLDSIKDIEENENWAESEIYDPDKEWNETEES